MNPQWDEAAYDALADVWVRITPDERDRVEAAVDRANRDLQTSPGTQGESRAGHVRVLIVTPITFWFRVLPNGVAGSSTSTTSARGPDRRTATRAAARHTDPGSRLLRRSSAFRRCHASAA